MKKIVTIALLGVVVYGAWTLMSARSAQENDGAQSVVVRVGTVQVSGDETTYTVGGTVRTADESTLAAQVAGTLTLHVRAGQKVVAGQTLATISAPEYGATVAQAQVAAASAEAAEAQARRQWDDLKPEAREQYTLASQQARAALSEARAYATKTVIRAPFAGEILATNVETGATVFPGAAVVRMGRAGSELTLDVLAQVAQGVQVGDTVMLVAGDNATTATVTEIARAANAITHKAQITLTIDDAAFAPGTFAQATFDVEMVAAAQMRTVPATAIVRAYDDAFVYTIDAQNIAHAHVVTVVAAEGGMVSIDGDIAPDARIAVTNAHRLTDGMRVIVID